MMQDRNMDTHTGTTGRRTAVAGGGRWWCQCRVVVIYHFSKFRQWRSRPSLNNLAADQPVLSCNSSRLKVGGGAGIKSDANPIDVARSNGMMMPVIYVSVVLSISNS